MAMDFRSGGRVWRGLEFLPHILKIRPTVSFVYAFMLLLGISMLVLYPFNSNLKLGGSQEGKCTHPNFNLTRSELLEEYGAKLYFYTHVSGAELISVVLNDANKVFAISFRTPVDSDQGMPHILEHSVLDGSTKYPVKEPFVELLKGSLYTFLNAYTYPDRTVYPSASVNQQDFRNLVDVYLDAVFNPACVENKFIFQQEGWRYELDSADGNITLQGVVYSEMRGAYSDPDQLVARYTQQALFPDNTYRFESGGDPETIPSLTYDTFQDFYKKFYHPSNARVWFYGNDEPCERLDILDSYLRNYDPYPEARTTSVIQHQPPFAAPKTVQQFYPVTSTQAKATVTVNWVLDHQDTPMDIEEQTALAVLNHLLLGTPASLLSKALMDSKLGDMLVDDGVDGTLLQTVFVVGLKGVALDKLAEVEQVVLDTLRLARDKGFPQLAVDASLNTIEFSLRENDPGTKQPRGLVLFLAALTNWLYDEDPMDELRFEGPLRSLRARLTSPEAVRDVFGQLIDNRFLKNTHRVTIHLLPKVGLGEETVRKEQEKLLAYKASLSPQQLDALVAETHAIHAWMNKTDDPADLAKVPALRLEDIDRNSPRIPTIVSGFQDATILEHPLDTNRILYVDAAFSLRYVDSSLLPLTVLLINSLVEMGTAEQDYVEFSQTIHSKTGGISVSMEVISVQGSDDPATYLVVSGKSVEKNAKDLFDLMYKVLVDVKLDDKQKFAEIVSRTRRKLEDKFISKGHRLALVQMQGKDNTAGWISQQCGGLSFLLYLRLLEAKLDQTWPQVMASMQDLRRQVATLTDAILNLTGEEDTLADTASYARDFLNRFSKSEGSLRATRSSLLPPFNEAMTVPTQVNYVGKGGNVYKAGYQLQGSAFVITNYIQGKWLWEEVRIKRAAYGAYCSLDAITGFLAFLSYRDPNVVSTLTTFDKTVTFLEELSMNDDTLTKAIIGAIGSFDPYSLPFVQGYTAFIRFVAKVSDEERQEYREGILSTKVDDFHDFAKWLKKAMYGNKGFVAIVASEGAVAAAIAQEPGLNLNVTHVL
ncbi:hypothetical protein CBR_g29853 [Chara braunii]|uniref:Peptidase M16C associated domain-containing protein n=1 Tax=Chara braunii TaxID=69332 RepID=A0A388JWR9_CHABU|nr:hypothetical protein CBR_g29853 [Chara braunii]|eukprot:GBG62246.1 hypothetical protein CBR_g29853 [Chara braunii]